MGRTIKLTDDGLLQVFDGSDVLSVEIDGADREVRIKDSGGVTDRINIQASATGIMVDIDDNRATGTSTVRISSDSSQGLFVSHTGVAQGLDVQHNNAAGDAARVAQLAAGNASAGLQVEHAGTGKHIDTDAGPGTPAHLTNAGVWTDASCWRWTKANVERVDERDLLERVLRLPIRRYHAKRDVEKGIAKEKTIGTYQEALVRLGLSPEGVRPGELAALAIGALQGLVKLLRDHEILPVQGGAQ